MLTVKIKVEKDLYTVFRGVIQWTIWNEAKILVDLPLNNDPTDIVTLYGERDKMTLALDRLVRGLSSTVGEQHIITVRQNILRLQRQSVVRERERQMEENERKRRHARKQQEMLEEVKGRGEESVVDSDYDKITWEKQFLCHVNAFASLSFSLASRSSLCDFFFSSYIDLPMTIYMNKTAI